MSSDALDFNVLNDEMQSIVRDIVHEFDRAVDKHPVWPKELWRQFFIVAEEVGEVQKAVLDRIQYADKSDIDFDDLDDAIDDEMIQVATMAIRFLYNRRRN